MSEKEKSWVEISKGYLVLNSKEAIDLFDQYSTTGTLWEILSMLFNEYSLNKNKNSELETQVLSLQEMMAMVLKGVNSMNAQLPPPRDSANSSRRDYEQSSIVEPIENVVVKTASKSKGSPKGLSDLSKKMSRFK